MIKVELLRPAYNGRTVLWQRLALFAAEDDGFTWIDGDPSVLDRSVPVVDLRNGRRLKFDENAEEWVRGLPTLFRGGDIVVNVLEDTNPLPAHLFEPPSDGDEPLELHDSATSHSTLHA